MTLIDTPGFNDPEKNNDAEIISDLAEKLTSMIKRGFIRGW